MSLSVYTGPMFSGKTTHMIQEVTRFCDISGLKAVVINHELDTRDEENLVSSHSSGYKGLSDKITVIFSQSLEKVNVDDYSIIGVDEACFFNDLYVTIEKWLVEGKNIVCAGLDGNYKMQKFGQISELLHLSDKFIKLPSICCKCLEELNIRNETVTPYNTVPAPFTRKKCILSSDTIDIGGSDKYLPVCRSHHAM